MGLLRDPHLKSIHRIFLIFILGQSAFLGLSSYWESRNSKLILRESFSSHAEMTAKAISTAFGMLYCQKGRESAQKYLEELKNDGQFEFARATSAENPVAEVGEPMPTETSDSDLGRREGGFEQRQIFPAYAEIAPCEPHEAQGELVVGYSFKNLDAPLQSQVNMQLRVFVIVAGLTALALFLLGQLLGRYLNRITARCQRIAKGVLEPEMLFDSSSEFFVVSDTLNSMVKSLKDMQQEQEAQRAKFIATAKMSSLGEMAGGIAHEINNPLAVIVGKASALLYYLKSVEKTQPDLNKLKTDITKIEATGHRIAKIVAGLRSFSRDSEKDPMEEVPLARVLAESLELCKERFRGHNIELKVPDEAATNFMIVCRSAQLSQVFINLLSNAFDAVLTLSSPKSDSPEKKWVEIAVEPKPQDPSRVLIAVTDCGHGIPKSVAEKIMQPFFTTKGVGKGTGLGLSISKGIVEEHGGHFYYDDSHPHTRFVIELPARPGIWGQVVA